MSRRIRTAKFLGTRHNREYFRAWTSARKLRVALTVALPLLACCWLLAFTLRGNSQPYSSGPLSASHNFFGRNCSACHAVSKTSFGRSSFAEHTSDQACLGCHNSPNHQAAQTFTPACADCHVEHKGNISPLQVGDKLCVQCHGDLHVKSERPRFEVVVKDFVTDHPEFRAVRVGYDPGTVALNHAAHMKAGVRGPNGNVQMTCQDCHRTVADASKPWNYSLESVTSRNSEVTNNRSTQSAKSIDTLPPSIGRAHMAPVSYEKQCAACHQLQFDPRIPDLVPHGKPEIMFDFVAAKYRQYLATHPEVWRQNPVNVRFIPGASQASRVRSPEDWIDQQTAQAIRVLWRKNCKLCHTIDSVAGKPQVRTPNITARWLPNNTFSHYSHQGIACESCHTGALESQRTSDVLIPGIAICRKCHKGNSSQVGSAGARCSLCHQYHDWTKQLPVMKAGRDIDHLRRVD
jgi:hypothetical protein